MNGRHAVSKEQSFLLLERQGGTNSLIVCLVGCIQVDMRFVGGVTAPLPEFSDQTV